jgi:hypothetical protein
MNECELDTELRIVFVSWYFPYEYRNKVNVTFSRMYSA